MMETKAKKGDLVRVTTKKHSILEFGEVVEIGTVFGEVNPQYEVADRYYDNGDPLFLRDGEFLLVNNPEDYNKLIEYGVVGELRKIYAPKDSPLKVFSTEHEEESPQQNDAVNHPSHYTQGRFETIEIIEEIAGGYDNGYVAYCVGNAIKYLSRAPHKHATPVEDLRKAATYLDFAIKAETRRAT